MASAWFILPIFLASCSWLVIVAKSAPALPNEEDGYYMHLEFPSSVQELQELARVTHMYYQVNWMYVLLLYSSAYIFKQTFAIPGTVFLNVLGGALFGVHVGFPLCCCLAAVGASCCYLLSRVCCRDVVQKYFPNELQSYRAKIRQNSDQLLFYMLFLRMFPMSPNWIINVLAPLIGVPLPLFFITVLIGLAPYVLICTQAGVVLSTLNSLEDLYSAKTILQMAGLALAALIPTIILRPETEPDET